MSVTPKPRLANPGKDLLTLLAAVDSGTLDAETVHRIRIAIKQVRAGLKFRRAHKQTHLDDREVVATLRALNAGLSGLRDRDVAIHTLTRLAQRYPGKKSQQLTAVLCEQLSQWQAPARNAQQLSSLCEQIRQSLPPFLQSSLTPHAQAVALQNFHARLCRSGERALRSTTCEDLHAWRKQVKTLGYQLQMLTIAPRHGEKIQRLLNRLGKKLGDLHDLCFLQTWIKQTVNEGKLTQDPMPLYRRIARARKALLDNVRKQYPRVCATPLHFHME